MIDFQYLRKYMEDKLNSYLTPKEQDEQPFIIYADIGDMCEAYRRLNTIVMPRYGIIRLISSEITPVGTLTVQELNAEIEVVVNVDDMDINEDNVSEYTPVVRVREVFDSLAAAETGQAQVINVPDGESERTYSVVPVYTMSSAGTFVQTTSDMGKIVPMSFRVNFTVIENGFNSNDVIYSLDGSTLYCVEVNETMTTSTEGQTHEDDINVVNTIQESKYGADLQIVMTESPICRELINIMHQGIDNEIHTLSVGYNYHDVSFSQYNHDVIITQVSQMTKRPLNVFLSVSVIEADKNLVED